MQKWLSPKKGSSLKKLESTSVSLRDSSSLKIFYNGIKNTHPNVAHVILEASYGAYTIGAVVYMNTNNLNLSMSPY